MPVSIATYERRDGADRNDLGNAALALCRASRAVEGVRTRYYWEGTDRVVLLQEAATPEAFAQADGITGGGSPEIAQAAFALAELSRLIDTRRLSDAAAGTQAWEDAGRPSGVR